MKNYTATDIVKMMLGISVSLSILMGGVAMLLRGSANPTPELLKLRELYFGLVQMIAGGVLAILGGGNKTKAE